MLSKALMYFFARGRDLGKVCSPPTVQSTQLNELMYITSNYTLFGKLKQMISIVCYSQDNILVITRIETPSE